MSEALLAVSPVDGRYADRVDELRPIVSEFGLIRYRVAVEAAWLGTLTSGVLPDVEPLGDTAQDYLRSIPEEFSVEDARRVKEIEDAKKHDVKAVELWLREKLAADPTFNGYLELIHFGCTSEDITNLAYAMMLRDAREKVLLPNMQGVAADLREKAHAYADGPLLARTHGEAATPSTAGKEMLVFGRRIEAIGQDLGGVVILGKFSGATGNYNAATFAYPEVDWPVVCRQFVENLGFEYNSVTTQIEPHDWNSRYFTALAHANRVQVGLAQDMWRYISNGILSQRVVQGEVGSSTMPHKVNPIDFENAEGNFGLANALLQHLADKLVTSRLQRDLSDSAAQRGVGEALGHTVVAQKSLRRGLGKIEFNEARAAEELQSEWSVLTEAVQTVMRRHGIEGAYDIIKDATRGKKISEKEYRELVTGLPLPDDAKARLLALTPATYIGRAADIAHERI